jgi:GntR family transcriptional regulator
MGKDDKRKRTANAGSSFGHRGPRRGTAYGVVAESLLSDIRAGRFPPNRRLPTEAELSARFGVSRQTVRQAFSVLVSQGLVYRVPGRGSFAVGGVSDDADKRYVRSVGSVDDLMALAIDTELEVIQPFKTDIDIAIANRLGLPSDEVAFCVIRRLHRGVPFCVTRSYVPPALADQIANDPRLATKGARNSTTIIGLLEELTSSVMVRARQSVTAAIADQDAAQLVDCNVGDPVLSIDRTYFDADGTAVELAMSLFNVQRYSYRIELRRTTA